jgi:5-formyltetrahydrofolate cyclo-ligase
LLLRFESNGSYRHRRVALPDSPPGEARRLLRASLRARRRALAPVQQSLAAERVARECDRSLGLRPGLRVALYCALPEELDTAPLIALAQARGCEVYLPRVTRLRPAQMRFHRHAGPLYRNRWGIPEPPPGAALGTRWLHVAFVPLVAFDAAGTRLGMGAGFYDRAFAWRHARTRWRGPLLVGLAHAFQQVHHLAPSQYDVALDAVITERGYTACGTGS